MHSELPGGMNIEHWWDEHCYIYFVHCKRWFQAYSNTLFLNRKFSLLVKVILDVCVLETFKSKLQTFLE